jgi:hypothetical protein
MSQIIHLSNLLPKEFCYYFTHALLRQAEEKDTKKDVQVPNALAVMHHEVMLDTLLEYLWPTIEAVVQEELLPTYSYARLYGNENALEKHIDREACEVSVTIQLGRSHNYSWPIYMDSVQYELNEGDAIIYPGCTVEHWRNKCAGPNGYYSGQIFLHYVRKNGDFANQFGDSTVRKIPSFVKNRVNLMENKECYSQYPQD